MSRRTDDPWLWTRNEGAPSSISDEHVLPHTALPDGMVSSASNVDLDERGILIPRRGTVAFSTAGAEPTAPVQYLFPYRNASTNELYAFTSSASHYWNGSTWTSLALKATAAFTRDTMAVHYNGKVFVAYNSTENRLHVLDANVMRSVGIGLVAAAATPTNTAPAGTFSGTRYYKIQQRLHKAADSSQQRLATSELSAVVSFTPSGANTGAIITKPATVDAATHWAVYASADNVTFYDVSGALAVATTTYTDTALSTAYSASVYGVAPEVGFFVPPPSARFLVTDGKRLLMAGAHETTASAGETTPSVKRVWFTRPLGATDKGDDEAITQTTASRYYIDVDDSVSSDITGMAAIGGTVYVFFDKATWRLVPAGIDGTPYRAEQVSASVGAMSQQAIVVGGTPDGTDDAVYFVSQTAGLHRISPARGLEWLGRDVLPRALPLTITDVSLGFDPIRRDLWVFAKHGGVQQVCRAIAVQYLRVRGAEYHGGARTMGSAPSTGVFFGDGMLLGGETGLGAATLEWMNVTAATDNGVAFTATVRGPVLRRPFQHLAVEEPTIQTVGTTATITVGFADRFKATTDARTASITVPTAADGYVARVEGLVLSDALSVQPSLSCAGTGYVVEALAMPVTAREAL